MGGKATRFLDQVFEYLESRFRSGIRSLEIFHSLIKIKYGIMSKSGSAGWLLKYGGISRRGRRLNSLDAIRFDARRIPSSRVDSIEVLKITKPEFLLRRRVKRKGRWMSRIREWKGKEKSLWSPLEWR